MPARVDANDWRVLARRNDVTEAGDDRPGRVVHVETDRGARIAALAVDGAGGRDPYHRWSHRMALAAAQAKLSGLVKGSLIGIQVSRHGVSPRIVLAAVEMFLT